MLEDHTRGSAFRVDLWQRADALGGQIRGQVGSRTSLSPSDIEDLWADLLSQAVQAPGTPGALPADAPTWTDAQLAGWLKTALGRDVIDEHRRRVNASGEAWVAGTPLEELEAELEGRSIFSSLRPPNPEEALIQRSAVEQRTEDLRAVVGVDAAQMMLAEASGATGPEQREMMDLSVGRWRTIQGRVEFAAAELRSRAQAVLVWLWPEAWVRWVAGMVGGAGSAVLSAGTAAKVAGTIAVVGGVIGGAEAVKKPDPPRAVTPTLAARPVSLPSATRATAARTTTAQPPVVAATLSGTRRAAASVRADAAAAKKRADAKRRAEARRRAATRRRAAARKAAATSRSTSAAAAEFAPQTARAPAPAPTPSTGSGGGTGSSSAAATEFEPSGR